ncbi:hypothetical protein BKM31_58715 [[Actinomadura] parvosata subsp. kistnae]|uniref:Uncharacterized protein n=1 Tax=[Actinomadura] parvosata subsp. kistnae TaxID=1909395 RepID=A0A1V0AIE8_9ACTN|nr:hypothetical protein BKM31_58715 [Nonomuraea sp. ATCC 55076]
MEAARLPNDVGVIVGDDIATAFAEAVAGTASTTGTFPACPPEPFTGRFRCERRRPLRSLW